MLENIDQSLSQKQSKEDRKSNFKKLIQKVMRDNGESQVHEGKSIKKREGRKNEKEKKKEFNMNDKKF